jgi:hypothetical protein
MTGVERILVAEETVAGLQSQLSTVETILETAEQVAVTGENAGRFLRRFFRILLLLSVVAVVVMIVKKVMGDRCCMGEESAPDSESGPETGAPDHVDDEAASDGDTDAT